MFRLLSDKLTTNEREELEHELANSGKLAEEYEQFQNIEKVSRALPLASPSRNFTLSLMEEVRAMERSRAIRRRVFRYAAASIAAIALLFFLWWSPYSSENTSATGLQTMLDSFTAATRHAVQFLSGENGVLALGIILSGAILLLLDSIIRKRITRLHR